VILRSLVLTLHQRVTDNQTDNALLPDILAVRLKVNCARAHATWSHGVLCADVTGRADVAASPLLQDQHQHQDQHSTSVGQLVGLFLTDMLDMYYTRLDDCHKTLTLQWTH